MRVKNRIIILVSVCLIVLVGAFVADRIMSKSYFNKIKYEDLIEKIENKEDFVLLISRTTCSHCVTYKPKLKEVANKYKVNIYYIDVDLLSDAEDDNLTSYINYDGTPVTVFLRNGEEKTVANRINGDASKEKIERKLKNNGFIN